MDCPEYSMDCPVQNTVLLERLVAASPTEDREAISLAELALISWAWYWYLDVDGGVSDNDDDKDDKGDKDDKDDSKDDKDYAVGDI